MHILFICSISVNAKQSICVHIQSVGACEGPFLLIASTFSVKFIIVVHATLCDLMHCSTQGFPVLPCLPEFAQFKSIESMMPSNHLILCHPLLLLPSASKSSKELPLSIRWPNYWSFSFSISSCNKYLDLISFRIDWVDLLEV